MDFAETINVKVYDSEDSTTIAEYYCKCLYGTSYAKRDNLIGSSASAVAFFEDLQATLTKMSNLLEEFKNAHPTDAVDPGRQSVDIPQVHDTTNRVSNVSSPSVRASFDGSSSSGPEAGPLTHARSLPGTAPHHHKSASWSSLSGISSKLNPFSGGSTDSSPSIPPAPVRVKSQGTPVGPVPEEAEEVEVRGQDAELPPKSASVPTTGHLSAAKAIQRASTDSTADSSDSDATMHTYPPVPSLGHPPASLSSSPNNSASVWSWLKHAPRPPNMGIGFPSLRPSLSLGGRKLSETVGSSALPAGIGRSKTEGEEPVMEGEPMVSEPETVDEDAEERVNEEFRSFFSRSERERVIASKSRDSWRRVV